MEDSLPPPLTWNPFRPGTPPLPFRLGPTRLLPWHDLITWRPLRRVSVFFSSCSILFCIFQIGINPGLTAAYVGHHYAGPGNHFCEYHEKDISFFFIRTGVSISVLGFPPGVKNLEIWGLSQSGKSGKKAILAKFLETFGKSWKGLGKSGRWPNYLEKPQNNGKSGKTILGQKWDKAAMQTGNLPVVLLSITDVSVSWRAWGWS